MVKSKLRNILQNNHPIIFLKDQGHKRKETKKLSHAKRRLTRDMKHELCSEGRGNTVTLMAPVGPPWHRTTFNTLLWMYWRRVYKSYSREKIIILFCLNSKLRALRDLWSNQGWCSLVGNHGGYNGMYLSSAAIPAPFLAPGLWYVWNRYESLLLAQGTRCSAVT